MHELCHGAALLSNAQYAATHVTVDTPPSLAPRLPAAGVYFAVIRSLEGHPEAVVSTLQAKFLPTLAANYMIWPLAHVINFRFVPSEYRILYNNAVCVAWLTGLSFLTHSKINFMQLLHLPHV